MRKIELSQGIASSIIGFGCAPVLGAVDATRAKKAIETALDLGVNHFDLARSYGYGEAERFVGNILRHRRHDMVIASKFGLKANWKANLLRSAKPLLRTIKNTLSKPVDAGTVEQNKPSIAAQLIDRIPLNKKEMRKSLEKSLQELQTDYLDYFFIHEPAETISNVDELLDEFGQLKKEGKIRAAGMAYMLETDAVHAGYKQRFDLLQFNRPTNHSDHEKAVAERGKQSNIIFSPFRFGSKNETPEQKLKGLSADFPSSVILCSMFNEKHIRQNIACFL